MAKIILLTGATGFIGSAFCREILNENSGIRLRCLIRPGSAHKIQGSDNLLEISEGDLTDRQFVESNMSGVSVIVHLAAMLRTGNPEQVLRFNTETTRILTDAAVRHDIRQFVYVSTENVMREDIQDAYAEGKREAEKIASAFARTLILRPSFVFGPGENHGIGRICAVVERFPVVPQFGGLKAEVQPLYIDEMTACLTEAVRSETTGTYMICGLQKITINDFIRLYCKVRKIRRFFVPVPKFLWRWLGCAADRVMPGAGWGSHQFQNIYFGRSYPDNLNFKRKQIPLNTAIERWVRTAQ